MNPRTMKKVILALSAVVLCASIWASPQSAEANGGGHHGDHHWGHRGKPGWAKKVAVCIRPSWKPEGKTLRVPRFVARKLQWKFGDKFSFGKCTDPGCLGDDVRCESENPCEQGSCNPDGTCTFEPVTCEEDDDPCTALACNPNAGGCEPMPNTMVACDDGNPCTTGDMCFEDFSCTGTTGDPSCVPCGTDVDCGYLNTGDACEGTRGVCIQGLCEEEFVEDDCPADPNGDLCQLPTCTDVDGLAVCGFASNTCNDSKECTSDVCDSGTGQCINDPQDALCNDGNPCTVDLCDADTLACSTVPLDCGDDGLSCTVETCVEDPDDPSQGGCVTLKDDSVCGAAEACDPDNAPAGSTTGCAPATCPCWDGSATSYQGATSVQQLWQKFVEISPGVCLDQNVCEDRPTPSVLAQSWSSAQCLNQTHSAFTIAREEFTPGLDPTIPATCEVQLVVDGVNVVPTNQRSALLTAEQEIVCLADHRAFTATVEPGELPDTNCGLPAPLCGNGVVDAGEECDDNNANDSDGCSSTCQITEVTCPCWDGSATSYEGATSVQQLWQKFVETSPGVCLDQNVCEDRPTPSVLAQSWSSAQCLNQTHSAFTIAREEFTPGLDPTIPATCEVQLVVDGVNVVPTNQRSALLTAEQEIVCLADHRAFTATVEPGELPDTNCGLPAPLTCGNGVTDPGEDCDDGDTIDGDGCAADCSLEGGGGGGTTCGDGVIDPGEVCPCQSDAECEAGQLCCPGGAARVCETTFICSS